MSCRQNGGLHAGLGKKSPGWVGTSMPPPHQPRAWVQANARQAQTTEVLAYTQALGCSGGPSECQPSQEDFLPSQARVPPFCLQDTREL